MAEAWARAHSLFLGHPPESRPPEVTLVLTPASDADAALLVEASKVIKDAIKLYADYEPSSARRDGIDAGVHANASRPASELR